MQLVKRNGLEVQTAQAQLDTLMKILRPPYGRCFCWSLAGNAPLGGDDQIGWVGMEGLVDEFLCDFRAIGVSRVDEVDAFRNGSAKNSLSVFTILRFSPCSFAYQAHGSVTEAMNSMGRQGESLIDHAGLDAIRPGRSLV
jgi:hypothetical protein